MRHDLTTLGNGLRVATERVEGVRSVAFGAWVGVGSRDEEPGLAGVSHFIEHMLFRGTARHDALQIAEIFDRFGAELNAATSRESTSVYARVRDANLAEALDVVAGMLTAPTWDELDAEREVVLEEIAMYEDAPDDLVFDMIGEAVFPDQGLGRPVVGTTPALEALTVDDVTAHHRGFYGPSNMVLAAAGNVDHAAFVELVDGLLGAHAGPARSPRAAATTSPPRRAFLARETEQYHVCLGGVGIARTDERRFALALLDQILGGGASSRLFQEIRERRGMAYSVYSYSSHYVDTGSVGIYVGTREENVPTCLEVIGRELDDLASGGLTDAELDRAKSNAIGRLALAMESTSARMSRLGRSLLMDVPLLDEDAVAARIAGVERAEVEELARTAFSREALSAACIGEREEVFGEAIEALLGAAPEAA